MTRDPAGDPRRDRSGENPGPDELTPEELEAEAGEELPDRAAMSVLDANVAIPIDAGIAASVLSEGAEDEHDEQQPRQPPTR